MRHLKVGEAICSKSVAADIRPGKADHVPFSLLNARVVLPSGVEPRALVVRDGLIHRIDAAHAAASRRIDCEGDYLLPGLIDLHTDNLEHHIEPRPGIFWNTDLAVRAHDAELASAGITTAFDAITLGADVGDSARERFYFDAVSSIHRAEAQGLLRIAHRLHYRCELGHANLKEELAQACERSAPSLISLMAHVPGQGQWLDVERFRRYYARRYALGPQALDSLIARRQGNQARFGEANRAVVIERARDFQCVLASHDDAVVADVTLARNSGCTVCEFPTTLEAAHEARHHGLHVVAGAPNLVRGGSHSGNVAAAALASAGLLDILASDYYPMSLLQAVFAFVRITGTPLHLAVATASATPARVMGLNDRGAIEEGRRADLVRVRETPSGPVVMSAWCAGRQVA